MALHAVCGVVLAVGVSVVTVLPLLAGRYCPPALLATCNVWGGAYYWCLYRYGGPFLLAAATWRVCAIDICELQSVELSVFVFSVTVSTRFLRSF